MVLKSYRIFKSKNKKKKRKVGIVGGAVSALIGIALLSETASAISRI